MLKRFQVLLEDWQEEYLRLLTDVYDISFSEACRFLFSLGTLNAVEKAFPEYKYRITKEEVKQFIDPKTSQEDRHKLISKLYFETRKAIEYRKTKVKKNHKK
jgi:hypothetical protein